MEELFALLILNCEEIIIDDRYYKKLHELFLNNPENNDLLYLEWESDIKKSSYYIKNHIDLNTFNYKLFGIFLMQNLKIYYEKCSDIKIFAGKMYILWLSLPENIKDKEPFFSLNYLDEPLSWGDKEQTRTICENMLNYYNN